MSHALYTTAAPATRWARWRLPASACWAATNAVALLSSLVLTLAASAGYAAEAPAASAPSTHVAADGAAAAALAQFNRALAGDDAAIADALAQWRALMAADPAQPAWRAYAGAATAMQARTSWLPWKKLAHADDGLALIDKALAQLSPAHDTQLIVGVPASLLVRFTAASTFNALPAMFNRGDRGARLMDELLKSPLLATAPLGFRGAVWLRAADDAARAQQTDEARRWLQQLAASGAPQAAVAQARLKSL
jgi:hypothetical protein